MSTLVSVSLGCRKRTGLKPDSHNNLKPDFTGLGDESGMPVGGKPVFHVLGMPDIAGIHLETIVGRTCSGIGIVVGLYFSHA